ncbi:MAG: TIM-barrel domain-containing protein [Cyclobacteriaceae bacterium]
MKKSLAISLVFIFYCTCEIKAQQSRTYESYNYTSEHLSLKVSDGALRLKPFTNEILEVRFISDEIPGDTLSHTISALPQEIETRFMAYADRLEYSTASLKAIIYTSPFSIEYHLNDTLLLRESAGYYNQDTVMGFSFSLKENEKLFGGGMRALGMNHRGHLLELYNRAHYGYETLAPLMNYCIPMVISNQHYALLFDNPRNGIIDIGHSEADILKFESSGGRMSYVLIAGNDPMEVVENYTWLSGRQPLPPKWILGNFSSRFGYRTQDEAEETIAKFQADSIPVDALVLDLYWFGEDIQGHMGNLDWDRKAWPKPEQMIEKLKTHGVKTVLITEPFVLTSSNRWDEAVAAGVLAKDTVGNHAIYDFYFGETGLIDIFDSRAAAWFWNIYKKHTANGIAGWWGDLGEPEVHPEYLQHSLGKADHVHNIYGHYWAKMLHKGYQQDFPHQRPFILMRSGFAGTQRYGIIPWTGDVNRSWGGLQAQPKIIAQMGMQGLGYTHSDLGGFAGGEEPDTELYLRWLQFGVFQPVFRPHAQEHIPPEPVFYPNDIKEIARKQLLLRYSMVPYNYTLMYENTTRGLPLMRPLSFAEPENTELFDYDKAWLWGNDILFAPVLEPGLQTLKVYLPKGKGWYDMHSGQFYHGGEEQIFELTKERIPVLVRAGAVIPRSKPVMSLSDYGTSHIFIDIYHHPEIIEGKGYFYNDDGLTNDAIAQEAFEIVTVDYKKEGKKLTINVNSEGNEYAGKPESRILEFTIKSIDKKPRKVFLNGNKINGFSAENIDKSWYSYISKTLELKIKVHLEDQKYTIEMQ